MKHDAALAVLVEVLSSVSQPAAKVKQCRKPKVKTQEEEFSEVENVTFKVENVTSGTHSIA